jgi:hypothetical protein
MSDAKSPTIRDGVDLGVKKYAMISRRNLLSLLAPLPLLPVVGPHVLVSDKPAWIGWTGTQTYQIHSDVERWCNSHGAGFNWRSIAERLLLARDLEREIVRRQRLSVRP